MGKQIRTRRTLELSTRQWVLLEELLAAQAVTALDPAVRGMCERAGKSLVESKARHAAHEAARAGKAEEEE